LISDQGGHGTALRFDVVPGKREGGWSIKSRVHLLAAYQAGRGSNGYADRPDKGNAQVIIRKTDGTN
jgi:hypothetical protein